MGPSEVCLLLDFLFPANLGTIFCLLLQGSLLPFVCQWLPSHSLFLCFPIPATPLFSLSPFIIRNIIMPLCSSGDLSRRTCLLLHVFTGEAGMFSCDDLPFLYFGRQVIQFCTCVFCHPRVRRLRRGVGAQASQRCPLVLPQSLKLGPLSYSSFYTA